MIKVMGRQVIQEPEGRKLLAGGVSRRWHAPREKEPDRAKDGCASLMIRTASSRDSAHLFRPSGLNQRRGLTGPLRARLTTVGPAGLGGILSTICAMLLMGGCGPVSGFVRLRDVKDLYPAAVSLQPVDQPVAEPTESFDRSLIAIRDKSGVVGYVGQRQLTARSGRFTIRVVTDRQSTVQRAEVMYYVGKRGGDISKAEFTRQFVGLGPGDPIRIGVDVDAVTGATISSQTMADGVREIVNQAARQTRR